MTLSRATEPVFLIKQGVRSVSPYYFEYKTPFKERWLGKSAPQILKSELGQTDIAVRSGVDSGRIYVTANNGKSGGPIVINGSSVYTHLLQGHDIIHNLQHCHEPNIRVHGNDRISTKSTGNLDSVDQHTKPNSVLNNQNEIKSITRLIAETIRTHSQIRTHDETDISTKKSLFPRRNNAVIPILYEDENSVVISKPGGVPTHPGGIYRYNTVSEILAHDLQYPVWPCHRLDKSTSGVMVFAKSKRASSDYMKLFSAKDKVEKWYVARVKGLFPYTACTYNCPVFSVNTAGSGYINVSNQSQIPTNSTTEFYRVYHNKEHDYSIVVCRPITGRMHQIRIHLRNLGFPIANDGLYNGQEEMSRLKNNLELQIYTELWKNFPGFACPVNMGPGSERAQVCCNNNASTTNPETISINDFMDSKIQQEIANLSNRRSEKDVNAVSDICAECSRPLYPPNVDPDSGIWLHALALRWLQPEHLASNSASCLVAAPCPSWCA